MFNFQILYFNQKGPQAGSSTGAGLANLDTLDQVKEYVDKAIRPDNLSQPIIGSIAVRVSSQMRDVTPVFAYSPAVDPMKFLELLDAYLNPKNGGTE